MMEKENWKWIILHAKKANQIKIIHSLGPLTPPIHNEIRYSHFAFVVFICCSNKKTASAIKIIFISWFHFQRNIFSWKINFCLLKLNVLYSLCGQYICEIYETFSSVVYNLKILLNTQKRREFSREFSSSMKMKFSFR